MQIHVIAAIFKRNLLAFFTNPVGYLFIFLFVLGNGYFAYWHDNEFFNSNIADLAPLNDFFPYLLLIVIPAMAMSVWAEERRSGTEELLLTLPARDFEVVLGKYLAVLGIYSIALLFVMVTNLVALRTMGRPDGGVLAATFLGYFLMGASLLSVCMVASLLTNNNAVAFILGVLFSACFVCIHWLESASAEPGMDVTESAALETAGGGLLPGVRFALPFDLQPLIEEISMYEQFAEFGRGVVPLSGLVYFFSIIGVMLYLNVFLLSRRHWAGSEEAPENWFHATIRVAGVAISVISLMVLIQLTSRAADVDLTAEGLNSLSADTRKILDEVDPKRPVTIEAFISADRYIPKEYVETKRDLEDQLRRFMGPNVKVNINRLERLQSKLARVASKQYGIDSQTILTEEDGRRVQKEFFLGVAVKSNLNEKVIPFFYENLPVEYELARAVRTVSQAEKTKIGVLSTDARLFGQFDFQRMRSAQNWLVLEDLGLQYDVEQVSPDSTIVPEVGPRLQGLLRDELAVGEDVEITPSTQLATLSDDEEKVDDLRREIERVFDLDLTEKQFAGLETFADLRDYVEENREVIQVLIVPLVSSLTQTQLDFVIEYVESGRPALILDDPMPFFVNPDLAAAAPKPPQGNPMMGGQPPPTPKGRLRDLLDVIGIEYDPTQIVWQTYNPYPEFDIFQPEFVFVTNRQGIEGFDPESPITSGLQEVLLIHPGSIREKPGADVSFTPLLTTGTQSGTVRWDDILTDAGLFGRQLNPRPNRRVTAGDFVLAAYVQSGEEDEEDQSEEKGLDVIFVADLDLISDTFYQLRRQRVEDFQFDNVPFILNCVDRLAGDESFFELRKKRPQRRSLETMEAENEKLELALQAELEKLQEDVEERREEAQARLDAAVDAIRNDPNLPPNAKAALAQQEQRAQQRRLDNELAELDAELKDRTEELESIVADRKREFENTFKVLVVVLPAIPILVIGLLVFFARMSGEREGVSPDRLVQHHDDEADHGHGH